MLNCSMLFRSCLLAGLASVTAIFGCKGPDNVMAPNTTADDPLPAGAYPEIVLLDGLERSLVKQGVGQVPARAGAPMTVRATIRSIVDTTTPVEFRFLFYGANDEALTRNPVWRQRTIQPRTRVTLEANAMVEGAQRFELEIRRPK